MPMLQHRQTIRKNGEKEASDHANVTDILEALSVLKKFSNSRTWMYGKGTSEPGWRICAGCVAFI